jgi:hypothetical protein
VNALASPEVGKYLNEHFCCSFQKVATFRIVGNQKQGGNVASYFCAPDGRVLHAVAGPVDSRTMLREAKWVIETAEAALKDAREDGAAFKAYFRKAHAARLRNEHGLVVEAVTYDPPFEQDPNSALTYNDPSGRPLAPRLPPPPVDGPDVTFREAQKKEAAAPGARALADRRGRPWVLGNQGRVHMLMASHCMVKIEKVYGTIFQDILGERISTKPVEVATPFPWLVRPKR